MGCYLRRMTFHPESVGRRAGAKAAAWVVIAALSLVVGLGLGSSGTAFAQEASTAACVPVDASLDSMRGHHTLSEERGRRAVVLFYEDRDHVYDNDALKIELSRYVIDNHLDERVVMYGVANLGDAGSVPEGLVRELIRPALERWGADILLDWEGLMRRPPYSFATAAANVAILDRSGCIVWRHTGTLDDDRRRDFYRTLRRTLAP